jgi:hypothetical protein
MPRTSRCRIESLFFWLGGVIFPPLWTITDPIALELGEVFSASERTDWINLSRRLSAGRISPTEFLIKITGEEKFSRISLRIESILGNWMVCDRQVLTLAEELAREFKLYLISDYPKIWINSGVHTCELEKIFSSERIFFTEAFHESESDLDVIQKLGEAQIYQTGKSLMVDADPIRTMQSVRAGYDATVYVDARRLKRDLWLWGLFDATIDSVH